MKRNLLLERVWLVMVLLMAVQPAVGRLRAAPAAAEETPAESGVTLIETVLTERGPDAARAAFLNLKLRPEPPEFPEREFITLGYRLLQSKQMPAAVAVLEMAVEVHPSSATAHQLLAAALYGMGRSEESMAVTRQLKTIRNEAALADFFKNHGNEIPHSAAEVVARHVQATGGETAWRAVQTLVVEIAMQGPGQEDMRLVRMYKRPHYYRQGVAGGDSFTSTDGRTVWRVRDGDWQVMASGGEPYIRMGRLDNWMLDYADNGIELDFLGVTSLDGPPLYHVRRTFPDGFEQDLLFSAATSQLAEVYSDYIAVLPSMKSYFSLWDYRTVGGIKIPHVFIRNVGSLGPPHGGVLVDVKVNVPLADSLFIPPDK